MSMTGRSHSACLTRFDTKMTSLLPIPLLNRWTPLLSDALPGGTRMGSMFHHIFENIRFQAVMDGPTDILADDDVRRLIASAMALYRIGGTMDAADCPDGRRHLAFSHRPQWHIHGPGTYCPQPATARNGILFPPGVSVIDTHPGTRVHRVRGSCGETIIRGFIDLVFIWQGRYYIADWKSNRLANGYDQTELSREMTSAGYALQYQLYTVAALRWLKRQLGDRFDPHHHFGGAVYIFIRGVGSEDQDGIFHVPPEQLLPVEALQETIQSQMVGLQW
jgi:exodeoxyribonuclease V beta subunit